MKAKSAKRITYEEQRSKCKEFILGFDDFDSGLLHTQYGRKKYLIRLVYSLQFSKKSQMKTPAALKSSMRTSTPSFVRKTTESSSNHSGTTLRDTLTSSLK